MAAELLHLDSVTFSYADAGWRMGPLSLALQAGEITAIIGPNGSGKSTLLKLAAGVLAPETGKVSLNGRNLADTDRRAIACVLGYLPQQIHYTFDYTVEEVVAMGRFPHLTGMGFLSDQDLRVVKESMRQTETLAYRDRSLSHLSGGECQRVYLASILAQEPRLLLLDEPTTALDIHHQACFFRLLRNLAADGMAVGVVTHDLNLASLYSSRLFLMDAGVCVREGTPGSVLQPKVLSEVYGEAVVVQKDPHSGKPIVLPIAENEARA